MPNLQNLKPCKPGETHNPNGRPKGAKNISTYMKMFLEIDAIKYPDKEISAWMVKNGYDNAAMALAANKLHIAMNTKHKPEIRIRASESIEDRSEGKPLQKTELTGPDGETLFQEKQIYDNLNDLSPKTLAIIQDAIKKDRAARND